MAEPASDADPPTAAVSVDDDSSDGGEPTEFSWLDPHPIFVIVLVGPEETPFGIQKDFLCSKCRHFREYFHKGEGEERTIEHVLRLSDTPVEVFAHTQHFLYTGNVFSDPDRIPAYDVLVDIWKLGHKLGVEGLCERTLEAMCERKRVSQTIPATPLLLQVWTDTAEGTSIRQLLLSWAAEYLRASDDRSDFARSLPKELLSELVLVMSACDNTWMTAFSESMLQDNSASGGGGGKHERESDDEAMDEMGGKTSKLAAWRKPISIKRARHAESHTANSATAGPGPAGSSSWTGQPKRRVPLPTVKVPRRRTQTNLDADDFSNSQKLKFCSHLLTRMLSGPGFWTRLVGPFREPVDPSAAGVPDYFTKVKRPMDLSTIKANMDAGRYATPDEFAADIRQIFANVYTYWKRGDPIWSLCTRLEKTFEQKYSQMGKWLSKADDDDLV